MPSSKPLAVLPSEFKVLDDLLNNMTHLQNGKPTGLLATNTFRKEVDSNFPNLMAQINKTDPLDARLNAALFRDYTMAASGYMLEPCHHGWKANKMYGRGTDFVPENLAVPIKILADRIGYGQLLLEYSYGYALNNWTFKNDPNPESSLYDAASVAPDIKRPVDDIKCIRQHFGCDNEAGFILVHVAIVSKTPKQVEAIRVMHEGISSHNREMFNQGIK